MTLVERYADKVSPSARQRRGLAESVPSGEFTPVTGPWCRCRCRLGALSSGLFLLGSYVRSFLPWSRPAAKAGSQSEDESRSVPNTAAAASSGSMTVMSPAPVAASSA